MSTTRLLEKIITRDSFFDCAAMKWGRDHEKEALDAFHASESEIHEAMSLHESGLLVSKNGYVAASPDAVMTCACHGKFAVEVKCPFSLKDDTVTNNKLISTKCDFLLWDADQERVTLKPKHKYRTQINSQMALLGVKQGYFIVWTRKSVWYELIEFDPKLWHDVSSHLEIFFQSFVVKHLLNTESFIYCGMCNKVVLPENEINEAEKAKEEAIICN